MLSEAEEIRTNIFHMSIWYVPLHVAAIRIEDSLHCSVLNEMFVALHLLMHLHRFISVH